MKPMSRLLTLCVALLLTMSSCVHEYPDLGDPRDVVLHFHHDIEWSYHDMLLSRGAVVPPASRAEGVHARYHLMFFRDGEHGIPVLEREVMKEDLAREDFDEAVALPPGNYEVYLWSDYADSELQRSFFFDSSDHANIVYSEPYNGNNELRDAFRAYASFTVYPSVEVSYREEVSVTVERPMARYEIVATDFNEFVQKEAARSRGTDSEETPGSPVAEISPADYVVKVKYTGYMPSCFDNFRNTPVDSRLDMEYAAELTPLGTDEARIGFDYVMVNGEESSVKVAVEIYNKEGERIASSGSFDVPTKRSQNTTVRGRFLTTKANQGISIDPTFSGEYNVYI